MKINVIKIAVLAFAVASLASCKNEGTNLKECSFEVQPDGSVKYTIEGSFKGSQRNGEAADSPVCRPPSYARLCVRSGQRMAA